MFGKADMEPTVLCFLATQIAQRAWAWYPNQFSMSVFCLQAFRKAAQSQRTLIARTWSSAAAGLAVVPGLSRRGLRVER